MGTSFIHPPLQVVFPIVVQVHHLRVSVLLYFTHNMLISPTLYQSSSSTHSSPYIYPAGQPQHTTYGYYPPTDVRPDNFLWNAVPPSTSTNVEIPVYTRRQVKDMIDVVSECLMESMVRPSHYGFIPC